MEKKSDKSVVVTIFILIIVFSILLVFLRQRGFFDFTGTDASAEIVAAAFVLIGGIFTAFVSIVGMLLRQTMEQRNIELREQSEKRLNIEAERESRLNTEAEKRLKLEAGVEAMKLLTLSEGKEHSQTLCAGVLFTLASLPMYDVAVIMLSKMLPDKEVTPDTASWLINKALLQGDENIQSEAARILYNHAEHFLVDGGGCSWPTCINAKWNLELPFEVRETLAFSTLKLILSIDLTDSRREVLDPFVITLAEIWRSESNNRIRAAVGYSLNVLLKIFPPELGIYLPSELIEYYSQSWLSVDNLKSEVNDLDWAGGFAGVEYAERFEKWISSGEKKHIDLKSAPGKIVPMSSASSPKTGPI